MKPVTTSLNSGFAVMMNTTVSRLESLIENYLNLKKSASLSQQNAVLTVIVLAAITTSILFIFHQQCLAHSVHRIHPCLGSTEVNQDEIHHHYPQ